MTTTRTNLVFNPNFERSGTDGWSAAGAITYAQDSTYAHSGTKSQKITPGAGSQASQDAVHPVLPGEIYSLSVWLYIPVGLSKGIIPGYMNTIDSAGGYLGTSVWAALISAGTATSGWLRCVGAPYTIPATGVAYISTGTYPYEGGNGTESYWLDDFLLERNSSGAALPDFSGDTPADVDAYRIWTGTPGLSSSQEITPTFKTVGGAPFATKGSGQLRLPITQNGITKAKWAA